MLAMPIETRMFSEAREASQAVARQLQDSSRLSRIGARLREFAPHLVLTCGRGSSDHAATFAKYLIETRAGVPTSSAALSVSSVYGARPRAERVLCIAISQSGRSPDLLATVRTAQEEGALVLALVNDETSPLAELADEVMPLDAGPEISVAATKSYIAALAAIAAIVSEWTEDAELRTAIEDLPALLDRAWSLDWSPMAKRLRDATNLYVIGRGLGFGIAQEAALKLKETSGLHAEAFSAAEVRHGPMALVKPGFQTLVFRQSDETESGVDELVADMAARDAEVLLAGPPCDGAIALPAVAAHPVLEPILQVQSFYRAANMLALARGLDPDRPPNLAKVTETL